MEIAVDNGVWWDVIFRVFILIFSIQWSMFAVSALLRTEIFFDVTGLFGFGLFAYLSYEWSEKWSSPRHTIQTAAICIWALRLGLFLFIRILKFGSDSRYVEFRGYPVKFFVAWTIQGIWVFVSLLPTLMLNLRHSHSVVPLGFRDYLGWSLFCIGFVLEVVADYQKAKFRNNPRNKNKFIKGGLWSMSRHPNFCGEIVLQFGLYLSASSEFKGVQLLSVLCPVFDYLMIAKISGLKPLEKNGLIKWGSLDEYREYIRKTPVLFPFPAGGHSVS